MSKKRFKDFRINLFLIFCFLFVSQNLFAAPATITFQARIVKPDATNLESSNVFFRFYYLYPKPVGTDNQCVIYVEEITGVNMTGSKGLVTLQMGTGTRTYGAGDLKDVFDNSTVSYPCQAGGTYTPAASDNRRVIIQFDDGSGVQTLPPSELTSVPYAMQSYNSQKLGNSLPAEFLKFTDFSGACAPGEYLTYDSVGSPKFTCAIPVGGGSGTVTSVVSGGSPIVVGGTATDPTISIAKATGAVSGYLSSADWTTFNSKLSNFTTMTSSDVTTALGYTPLNSAGSVTSVAGRTGAVTLSSGDITGLAFGTTTGTYAQGNDSRFTDTRTPTDNTVTTTKILDGTITSADISAGAISFDKLNQSSATPGQVIKWDGAAWVASSDASLVSSDISTALGYTAANSADVSAKVSKAGDTMSGVLNIAASSASADLSVTQSGAGPAATFMGGNVGIGTTTPGSNLDIVGTDSPTQPYLKISDASNTFMTVERNSSRVYRLSLGYPAPNGAHQQSWIQSNLSADGFYSSLILGSGATDPWNTQSGPTLSMGSHVAHFNMYSGRINQQSTLNLGNYSNNAVQQLSIQGGITDYSNPTEIATQVINSNQGILELRSGPFANTSGDFPSVKILPIYNQASGTAKNTDLLINRTETAIGSGQQNLIDAQVGGVSKFRVDNAGIVYGDGSGLTNISGAISGLTTGTLPKAGSATTLVDSVITESSGNVGIGTISPSRPLHVVGEIRATGGFSTEGNVFLNNSGSDVQLGNSASYTSTSIFSGATKVLTATGGKAGVGTATPTAKLDVEALPGDGVRASSSGSYVTLTGNGGAGHPGLQTSTGLFDFSSVVIGGTGGAASPSLRARATAGGALVQSWQNNAGTDLAVVTSTGNLGIGVTNPSYALQVSGDISVSGNFKVNGVNIASGTLNSVTSAGAPIVMGGTSVDPTVSITKATAAADGYLSSSDWTTFNNKLANFATMVSSDISTALGYTVANSTDVSLKVSKSGDTMSGPLVNNTNSASTALAISQDGSGYAATFMGGNVGIGTTSPTSMLQVTTGSNTGVVTKFTNGYGNPASTLAIGWPTLGYRPSILFGQSGGGGYSLDFANLGDNGATKFLSISDTGEITAGPATNSKIIIKRSTAATSITNALSFLNLGGLTDKGSGSYKVITFGDPNYTHPSAYLGYLDQTNGDYGKGSLIFGLRADSSADNSAIEAMRITNGGNVGIGVTNPSYALQVSGDISVSGNFKVNGVNISSGSGTVNSVTSAGSPIVMGGTSVDPTVSITKATTAVDGYLSSADWTTFNNKLSDFTSLISSDITTALGFTPLKPANNLSDVASADASLNNLLPAQSASSVLQSNGTNTSWLGFNTTASNNTLVQRDGSGVVTANGIALTNTGTVTVSAPALSATYSLVLPGTQGGNNQVMVNNGSGALSWITPLTDFTALTSSDVTTALGYTAANSADVSAKVSKAGDTMTGALSVNLPNSTGTTDLLVNSAIKTTGNLVDLQVGGSSKFKVDWNGVMTTGQVTAAYVFGTAYVASDNYLSGTNSTTPIKISPSTAIDYAKPIKILGGKANYAPYGLIGADVNLEAGEGNSNPGTGFASGGNVVIDGGLPHGTGLSGNILLGSVRGKVGIGNTSPGTLLDVAGAITSRPYGTSAGETGQLILRELAANGTNTVALRAPDSISSDVTWALPSADGTNGQILSTNGSGALSWATALTGFSSMTSTDVTTALGYTAANSSDVSAKVSKAGDTMTGALVNNTNSASTALAISQDGSGYAATFMGGNVGVGTVSPSSPLTVNGVIESKTGGVKFPDGTTQTTAVNLGYGMAYRISNLALGSTYAVIDLNGGNEALSNVSHSTSTNPSRLSVGQSGTYRISYKVNYSNSAVGTPRFFLKKNSTTTLRGSGGSASLSATWGGTIAVTTIASLSANDYVELYGRTDSTTTLSSLASYGGSDSAADDSSVSVVVERLGP